MERQGILHPEENARAALEQEDEKRLRLVCGGLAAGVLLAAAASAAGRTTVIETILRPGAGEESRTEMLEGIWGEQPFQVSLKLESRRYTWDEWEALKKAVWEDLLSHALGENEDWDHIGRDLNLETECGIPAVTISWESSRPEWIQPDGTLGEDLEAAEGKTVVLTAVIQWEDAVYEPQVAATIHAVPLPEEEKLRRSLTEYLKEAASDREREEVPLPKEYRGVPLRFFRDEGIPPAAVLFLAGAVAAAAWFLPEQKRREEEKRRRAELEKAYPELISSLTVLMESGLPIRSAWERMVMNYRRSLAAGGARHFLYEEMSIALNSLGQGTLEEEVYVRFGRRCGLQPYLRLGSLLQSNLKKGSRGLLPLMREEAESALEQRLRDARKHGEEISSRLLLPMILQFALIMAVLIAPAILSF